MIDRRQLLKQGAVGAGLLALPQMVLAAAPTDRRFVFIIQRGAADGLATVMPTGDPGFAPARGALAIDGGMKLDGLFTLHPALGQVGALYRAKEALLAHAVASPYRDRSHFDGQNVLETGGAFPYQLTDGWLSRFVGLLPDDGLRQPTTTMRMRIADLTTGGGQDGPITGALAARLLTGPGSARIAMIETGGWDTHAGQNERLSAQLKGLDGLIGALKAGLGPVWADTVVLVATEFGRTVATNGTQGTDHGTGSCAMLIGGAVQGGRVVADWPGLSPSNLYEGRDLKPTLPLDLLIAGALGQHFGVDPARVRSVLFSGEAGVPIGRTLIRS